MQKITKKRKKPYPITPSQNKKAKLKNWIDYASKAVFLKILSVGDVTFEVGSEFQIGITLTAKKCFRTLFLDIGMASRKG